MKRTNVEKSFKKILVPVDFSPPSELALRYACELARPFSSEITLMHVIDSLTYSVTDTLNIVEHRRALETLATTLLANLRAELEEEGFAVKTHLTAGTPYTEILDRAEQNDMDLIVMGTHGRTGVEHLLIGSVAERVVRLAPCAVLTVRPPTGKRPGRNRGTNNRPRRERKRQSKA